MRDDACMMVQDQMEECGAGRAMFVVRMLRSWRDSLTLAVIFMSLPAVSQRSTDICVGPGESWIHWIMGCGAAGTCAGGWKPECSGSWCFHSCSMVVKLGL